MLDTFPSFGGKCGSPATVRRHEDVPMRALLHADRPRRRVLVVAGASAVFSLRNLFAQDPLMAKWEPVEAESLARARFVMQHHPCELAIVHDDLLAREREQALSWLKRDHDTPLIVLAGDKGPMVAQAYQHGADICLTREMLATCPSILAAALERAVSLRARYQNAERAQQQVMHCRRHMDRLVNLIWRTTPMGGDSGWGSQRYTLERLQEEVSRVQRHGGAFTIAVAEMQPEKDALDNWTSELILKEKRRCDVAGQYGLRGFLLLMVQTPKAGGVMCCRRLQRLLQTRTERGPHGPVRALFGLASCSPEIATPQALLRAAEQNLERAKTADSDGIVAE